ncbi:hypothetical protein CCR75_002753 [Bremia lactucae]|uniref:Uncharacterized protein n=1 Tax=Bremia lactucae TaxID=4779 RepID=A0A976IJ05_BRELC|nr:hypothetical protein CCR75_002753 [Bremia lactucae]
MSMTPLPPGWLVRVSRSKSKIYYHNTSTLKTQWSRPTPEEIAVTAPDQSKNAHDNTKRQKLDLLGDTDDKLSALHARIVASMRVGGSSISRGTKKTVKFDPWPHQVTAVKQVITAIQTKIFKDDVNSGGTERFLLQHSTGGGKTMTIAALSYQLLYVKDTRLMRFHTVVVMLDRVKLNEQVGDAVETFLRRNGVSEVFRAESIEHLAKLLDATTTQSPQRVIITTTHKIGLLGKDIVLLTRLLHRSSNSTWLSNGNDMGTEPKAPFQRVGIITDEAHRSHSSSTRDAIETVVKAGEGSCARVTFIGFTATPNADALKLFGFEREDDYRYPFHCYPIAEAIADDRIINVLNDYTCVLCEVETSVIPEPFQEILRTTRGARRRLLDHASDDVAVSKAKASIMMTHFQAMKQKHFRYKCMIVARSRQDVVRYYKLITSFVGKKTLGWNCYAAFSGSILSDFKPVTEQTLNHRSVTLAISDVIIVCDKLDTGYNEPLLACMYIDRYLRANTHTVQLLSRLNRRHKHKPSVCVLDFANHPAQIRQSFAAFWREAKIPKTTGTIDTFVEQGNIVTAVTVLCDHFPELCASQFDIKDTHTFVEERVLLLERDAFQQVVDALRRAVVAIKKLEKTEHARFFESVAPFSYNFLNELKKETESHVVAVDTAAELSLDKMKSKMSARVHKYCNSFSGTLYPQSLLDRTKHGYNLRDIVPCLRQFGELECLEAFLVVSAMRNKQQVVDSFTATQLVEASSNSIAAFAASKGSEKEKPRMLAQLNAFRDELAALLRIK